jgi:hypothetical protein
VHEQLLRKKRRDRTCGKYPTLRHARIPDKLVARRAVLAEPKEVGLSHANDVRFLKLAQLRFLDG